AANFEHLACGNVAIDQSGCLPPRQERPQPRLNCSQWSASDVAPRAVAAEFLLHEPALGPGVILAQLFVAQGVFQVDESAAAAFLEPPGAAAQCQRRLRMIVLSAQRTVSLQAAGIVGMASD